MCFRYCECFANGLFCNENCGCSDCLNKLDQEEIILQSRQVIEGRNSHAFAPKVVLHATQPPKVISDLYYYRYLLVVATRKLEFCYWYCVVVIVIFIVTFCC